MSHGIIILQGGYMVHDTSHNISFTSISLNKLFAWIFGDVLFGVSSRWWKYEHDQHHSVPLSFDEEGIVDPQHNEDLWFLSESVMKWYSMFHHRLLIP